MNKTISLLIFVFVSFNVFCDERKDLLTFESNYSVKQTGQRLLQILENKGFTIFNNIDHSQAAKKVNIKLQETTVIIFGNPKIGSKLMQCSPTIAIDLPQKALIWQDSEKKVWMSVNNPEYLKQRHNVHGCDQYFTKITSALNSISTKVTN